MNYEFSHNVTSSSAPSQSYYEQHYEGNLNSHYPLQNRRDLNPPPPPSQRQPPAPNNNNNDSARLAPPPPRPAGSNQLSPSTNPSSLHSQTPQQQQNRFDDQRHERAPTGPYSSSSFLSSSPTATRSTRNSDDDKTERAGASFKTDDVLHITGEEWMALKDSFMDTRVRSEIIKSVEARFLANSTQRPRETALSSASASLHPSRVQQQHHQQQPDPSTMIATNVYGGRPGIGGRSNTEYNNNNNNNKFNDETLQQQQQRQRQQQQQSSSSSAPTRRPQSMSMSTRSSRPPPSGICKFDVVSFNVLNEDHYRHYNQAAFKMDPKERHDKLFAFVKNIVRLHGDNLGFMCLQEVNFGFMLPILEFLVDRKFDFIFSLTRDGQVRNGASVSFQELKAAFQRDQHVVPRDLLCIVFNTNRFKTQGNATMDAFIHGSSLNGPAGGDGSNSGNSGSFLSRFMPSSSSVNPAKAWVAQLFINEATNRLVKVVNCHIPYESGEANKIAKIEELLSTFRSAGPEHQFVLCGDFNIDEKKDLNVIRNTFGPANWMQATERLPWTCFSPAKTTQKLDYIFIKGNGIALDSQLPPREAVYIDPNNENVLIRHQGQDPIYPEMFCSDHASVVVKLEMK